MSIFNHKKIVLSILFVFCFFVFNFNISKAYACNIISAEIAPYSTQTANWYTDNVRPNVNITIKTSACAGQNAEISLVEDDTVGIDDDVAGLDNQSFLISPASTPTNPNQIQIETTEINLRAGETECESFPGTANDCDYFLDITVGTNSLNTESQPFGTLNYDCDGACDENWQIINLPSSDETVIIHENTNQTNTDTEYKLLAPFPGFETFETDPEKNKCAFADYFNIFIKIFIGICAVLAMVYIIIGGMEYMTSELPSGKGNGKGTIVNAVLGLILALGSYAILNTLNPRLLEVCLNQMPKAIVFHDDIPQEMKDGKYCGKYTANADWPQAASITDQSKLDATIRQSLSTKSVSVNPGNCSKVGQQSCTSLDGIDTSAINTIADNCKTSNGNTYCPITITGGTECWLHSTKTSHMPGSSTMDIRESGPLNKYITGGIDKSGKNIQSNFPNDGKIYTKDGIKFMAETMGQTGSTTAKHWHVTK